MLLYMVTSIRVCVCVRKLAKKGSAKEGRNIYAGWMDGMVWYGMVWYGMVWYVYGIV